MVIEPWHWFVFGVILCIAEIILPTFFLLWFGAAAIVVSLLSFITPFSLVTTTFIWLIISVVFCVSWFKFIQPRIKTRTKAGLGASAIIGETGILIQAPTANQTGKVRFSTPKAGASEWVCRSLDDLPLEIGDRVSIVNIFGNELLVAKK